MRLRPGAMAIVAIICILQPLMRFFSSPTFETARAVDIVLVFAAGAATGVLLASSLSRSRT